ncbi:UNVERIFIED_CONTAM: hypothetical protein Scaly_0063700 [Sesamum calycinum]|uniref:Aminotransferase-like plant mobile domain-containing protein n=1 Tax=Sesamum calycinum TaxID=2727403 RepID=A0AAW2SWF7_9LAMI
MNELLYDEVVPCVKELDGVDEMGRSFVPRSFKFLLHAYHLFQGSNGGDQFSQVPTDKWIKFWFKRATKYCESPPRKEKKAVRPKSTHNLSGTFGVHGKWLSAEEALFSKLGIEGNLKEETFLAAYLACWLCTFTLPTNNVGLIRPSIFKVANIIAAGQRVGLVVPVLASIYQGLNKISGSSRLIHVPSPFLIHVVYSWIEHYYKSHYQVLQGVRGPKMTLFYGEGDAKYYDLLEAKADLQRGFLEENVVRLLSSSLVRALAKDKERVVEVLETSKKKSVSRPLEENESSNLNRHWKRPKRDSNISKPMNVDEDEVLDIAVEELLNAFFAKVTAYDEVRSSSFEKLSKGLLERQLKEANTHLQDAQAKESEEVSKIQSTMDELERIEKKLVDLKGTKDDLMCYFKGAKAISS